MAGLLTKAETSDAGLDSYYASATTRTKPNSTLFIAFDQDGPEPDERASMAERLFVEGQGYVGVRSVRNLVFVDYADLRGATAAMMKWQGKHGMTIDYDKDDGKAEKRRAEADAITAKRLKESDSVDSFCGTCGTKALRTGGKLLSAMPTRSTGDIVVDEAHLASLLLEPTAGAQPCLVRRAKGTEKQFKLSCRSCSTVLAYRSTATPAPGKFLYLLGSALRETPLATEELRRRRQPGQDPVQEFASTEQGADEATPSAK